MKNSKIFILTAAVILGITTINYIPSFAETSNAAQNLQQNNERPQKPENEIIGKITSISANSVTISLANRKMPENNGKDNNLGFRDGQKSESFNANGQGFNGEMPPEPPTNANGEKPAINLDEFFTLTGESATIDISSAKFDDFREKMKNNNSSNSTNETATAKTYKDYSVGDYIMIELTSSTSKVAKSVRSANMIHGANGPRGPKPNNAQNNQ